jgi:steroid delta-isomerase-like uncharacterized protein
MSSRRNLLSYALVAAAGTVSAAHAVAAAPESCPDRPHAASAASALLDRYVQAVNAHDTGPFAELFSDGYLQHSGRSPSGLAAQVENFQRIFASMPDVRMQVEDRVFQGDRLVARNTFSATHTQTLRGIPPTGKAFTFSTIDIWRMQDGKFAEHWDLSNTAEVLNGLRTG